jgi:predicted branched-subunit amino acid permease
MKLFFEGFRSMIMITPGIVPFGAIMGTVCANADLSLFQSVSMNFLVFAGAAQLAAMELMSQNAAAGVVVMTGLIINLRFLLYSAAMSPIVQKSGFMVKLVCSYWLTDQSYAVMSANHEKFKTNREAIHFYLGTCVCMALSWHLSVIGGFVFGNFAPASWSLDYAVPLSFLAFVVPALKNSKYVVVAAFSSVVSLLLNSMPYKLGLIVTALLAIGLAAVITRKKALA